MGTAINNSLGKFQSTMPDEQNNGEIQSSVSVKNGRTLGMRTQRGEQNDKSSTALKGCLKHFQS